MEDIRKTEDMKEPLRNYLRFIQRDVKLPGTDTSYISRDYMQHTMFESCAVQAWGSTLDIGAEVETRPLNPLAVRIPKSLTDQAEHRILSSPNQV